MTDFVKGSLRVLKHMQLKNGAIIATLRNDAYPFVYPRDASIITKAFNKYKESGRSKKFYRFIKPIIMKRQDVFQRYSAKGLPLMSKKHEHDNDGLLIDGIHDTFQHSDDTKFLHEMWPLVELLVTRIKRHIDDRVGLLHTERSIHEFADLENGFEIWANSTACKGLFSASDIAKDLGKDNLARKWQLEANTLRKHMIRKLFDSKNKIFVKVLKDNGKKILSPDITQLTPFYFGIVKSDEILQRMLKWLTKNLWYDKLGGFLRYKKFDAVKDWHWYTGGFGPFPQFTLWVASLQHDLNDINSCSIYAQWVEKIFTKKSYLPEHISIESEYKEWAKNEYEFSERILLGMKRSNNLKKETRGVRYWATPLGWANAEYLLLNDKIC